MNNGSVTEFEDLDALTDLNLDDRNRGGRFDRQRYVRDRDPVEFRDASIFWRCFKEAAKNDMSRGRGEVVEDVQTTKKYFHSPASENLDALSRAFHDVPYLDVEAKNALVFIRRLFAVVDDMTRKAEAYARGLDNVRDPEEVVDFLLYLQVLLPRLIELERLWQAEFTI